MGENNKPRSSGKTNLAFPVCEQLRRPLSDRLERVLAVGRQQSAAVFLGFGVRLLRGVQVRQNPDAVRVVQVRTVGSEEEVFLLDLGKYILGL